MFVVSKNMTFAHAVKVFVPVDGGHEKQSFKVTFRVVPTEEETTFDTSTAEGSTGLLKAIVVGMDELVDDQGQPVPYCDALRDQLLSLPFIRVALVRAYYAGVQKAAEGN